MVVSHDRYFMDKVVDHLFVFRGDAVVVAVRRAAQPLELLRAEVSAVAAVWAGAARAHRERHGAAHLAVEQLAAGGVLAGVEPEVVQLLGRVREAAADDDVRRVLARGVGVRARERVIQAHLRGHARRPRVLVDALVLRRRGGGGVSGGLALAAG